MYESVDFTLDDEKVESDQSILFLLNFSLTMTSIEHRKDLIQQRNESEQFVFLMNNFKVCSKMYLKFV